MRTYTWTSDSHSEDPTPPPLEDASRPRWLEDVEKVVLHHEHHGSHLVPPAHACEKHHDGDEKAEHSERSCEEHQYNGDGERRSHSNEEEIDPILTCGTQQYDSEVCEVQHQEANNPGAQSFELVMEHEESLRVWKGETKPTVKPSVHFESL